MSRPEIIVYRDSDDDFVISVNGLAATVTEYGSIMHGLYWVEVDEFKDLTEVWRSGDKS